MKMEEKRQTWNYICIAHFIRCLGDRSFSFFLPLYLSKQCQTSTLRPTAALTFVQNLSVTLLSTSVAKLYKKQLKKRRKKVEDTKNKSERKNKPVDIGGENTVVASDAFVMATVLENTAVLFMAVFIYAFLNDGRATDDNNGDGGHESGGISGQTDCNNPLSSNYFLLALFCGCIDVLFSSLLSMIISKEWVAILFCGSNDGNNEENNEQSQLAKANAFLSQIDLVVGALCPLFISYLISLYGYDSVLAFVAVQHIVGASIIIVCIRRAVALQPHLASANMTTETSEIRQQPKKREDMKNSSFPSIFNMLPIQTRLISIAYILLYFTILSPGAMLNSWMNSMGSMNDNISIVTEGTIAYFGSMSQFCGAIATVVTPILIKRTKSLSKASLISQSFQTICVLYGFACFYQLHQMSTNNSNEFSSKVSTHEMEGNKLMIHFLVSIGLSRIGLWSFDLVERQVLQESVPRLHQTIFFNGEKSLTQLFSLGMMALCYIFPNPNSFIFLVICSLVAVCFSSVFLMVQYMISS